MKKALKIFGFAAALVVFAAIAGFLLIQNQARSAMAALSYGQVSMADAQDGVYEGEADAGLVAVRVKVAVKGGAIESIELLKHDNGMGRKAESILGEMERADTSETIKSAVSLALNKSASN